MKQKLDFASLSAILVSGARRDFFSAVFV